MVVRSFFLQLRLPALWVAWTPFAGILLAGCSGGDEPPSDAESNIGKPCLLEAEKHTNFDAFRADEVNLYCDAAGCWESVGPFCMSYYFQGRATCPYGQSEESIASLPATDPARCRVPSDDGTITAEPVTLAVAPQLVDRRAENTVFFTCACAGTDANREYCACPAAMHCDTSFAGKLSFQPDITGLCVRDDAVYEPASASMVECSMSSDDPATDCGNERQNP
jgi:hypothetical protein